MRNLTNRFSRDRSAATSIEYGLVVGAIAMAIFAVVQLMGSRVAVTLMRASDFGGGG